MNRCMNLNKRHLERIGDKLVITDVEITQRVVPAEVDFDDLLKAVQINADKSASYIEFAGYESDGDIEIGDDVGETCLLVANVIADSMEFDGIKVLNRRKSPGRA